MIEYKVMTWVMQGLYICAIPVTEISGIQAHIKLSSGQIKYVSEPMSKEAAEAHCETLINDLKPKGDSNNGS